MSRLSSIHAVVVSLASRVCDESLEVVADAICPVSDSAGASGPRKDAPSFRGWWWLDDEMRGTEKHTWDLATERS